LENRSWPRYQVAWPIKFTLTNQDGVRVFGTGALENVSAQGALMRIDRSVGIGARLDLSIKLPFSQEAWMLYSAEVLRIEPGPAGERVAVEFSPSKPTFTDIA
jgi:PilZ domain